MQPHQPLLGHRRHQGAILTVNGTEVHAPGATGEVVRALLEGQLIDLKEAEVRDLDEEAFRNNQVRAKHYGDMRVPQLGHFVQSVKMGGTESEELVLADIAANVSSTACSNSSASSSFAGGLNRMANTNE